MALADAVMVIVEPEGAINGTFSQAIVMHARRDAARNVRGAGRLTRDNIRR